MEHVTAGQIRVSAGETPVADTAVTGIVLLIDEVHTFSAVDDSPGTDCELSDLELLADGLVAALTAKRRSLVLGGISDLTLAERRARRADARARRALVVAA